MTSSLLLTKSSTSLYRASGRHLLINGKTSNRLYIKRGIMTSSSDTATSSHAAVMHHQQQRYSPLSSTPSRYYHQGIILSASQSHYYSNHHHHQKNISPLSKYTPSQLLSTGNFSHIYNYAAEVLRSSMFSSQISQYASFLFNNYSSSLMASNAASAADVTSASAVASGSDAASLSTPTGNSTNPPPRRRPLVPKREIITMTPAAISRVKSLLSKKPDALGLAVGIRRRGCNGLSYTLDYVMEEPPKGSHEIVEKDGVKLYVDQTALFYVIGTEMNYIENEVEAKFDWKNPKAKSLCGCGDSFSV